jgi:hypothetical protein
MLRVIIDTNVIVSALIQRNYPNYILYEYVLENLVEICISNDLFEEYLEVLKRPKFSRYPDFVLKAEFVLAQIETKSKLFFPAGRIDIIADKADNRLLELAFECKADYIVTGNTNDFTMPEFEGTKIVNPKEFWEILMKR